MISLSYFKEEFMLNDNEFTIEDIRGVGKRAKFLNTALIVATLVYFVLSWVLNGMFAFSDPTLVVLLFSGISIILAVIILIFSILTFGKMRFLKIEGGGQLLASSIIYIFRISIRNCNIGIVGNVYKKNKRIYGDTGNRIRRKHYTPK